MHSANEDFKKKKKILIKANRSILMTYESTNILSFAKIDLTPYADFQRENFFVTIDEVHISNLKCGTKNTKHH